jgi:transcriptional regulator with XRE-family HTH domain
MSTTDTTADARRQRNARGAATLRRIRYARGMSVAELADALDVAERTVYAWEQGNARPEPTSYAGLRAVLDIADDEHLWFTDDLEVAR